MTTDPPQHPETTAITAGRSYPGRSLAPPLYPSTTFELESVLEGQKLATRPKAAEFYSRYGNPTVNAFEDAVAEMEGAEAAQAFGSGMGAITSTILSLCSTGSPAPSGRSWTPSPPRSTGSSPS